MGIDRLDRDGAYAPSWRIWIVFNPTRTADPATHGIHLDLRPLCTLLPIAAMLYLAVEGLVRAVFWPSVRIDRHFQLEGMQVEQIQVGLADADWTQRLECVAPSLILLALLLVPGGLVLGNLRAARGAFDTETVAELRASARWCTAAALAWAGSTLVCEWLLSRQFGSSVSLTPDIVPVLLIVALVAVDVYLAVARHGVRLRNELDEIL
ncbi:hypothetical protein [Nocardia sp. IFM 10818]